MQRTTDMCYERVFVCSLMMLYSALPRTNLLPYDESACLIATLYVRCLIATLYQTGNTVRVNTT